MLKITLLVAVFLVALGVPAFAQTQGDDDDYTPPAEVGGTVVTRGQGDPGTGQLPRTGSNNTPSLVLIGLGAIAVGGVIVVASRRRSQVLTRA
jgi:LPXTG-motif cell wall-anchored protein